MIKVYNRTTGEYEIEQIAGEKYLNWTYSSPIGMTTLEKLIKKKFFSSIYGKYCDSKLSKKKVTKFINEFNIDMNISYKKIDEFKSFNDFFYRTLKEDARPIDFNYSTFISPGDGRLTVHENIDLNNVVQIKGFNYSLKELIGNDDICNKYNGGICLILRLCPLDYHRFHFIDDGICEQVHNINGFYYSVNPIALNTIENLYCKNKRAWSIFHSKNFGDILYVEVGATCVGTIIQTYAANEPVKKGEEKGYFKFGGSTTILFIEKNKVVIDDDILKQSKLGFETKINMGETIGTKLSSNS